MAERIVAALAKRGVAGLVAYGLVMNLGTLGVYLELVSTNSSGMVAIRRGLIKIRLSCVLTISGRGPA